MDERRRGGGERGGGERARQAIIGMAIGTLVYYHCVYRHTTIISLFSDVFIVLLCSIALLGLLFRQMNIEVPVDPLEWQISEETANAIVACIANTVGAAESVLRVAATGHDKRLFLKVIISLYLFSALGRFALGITVAYAGVCLFCLYILAESSQSITSALTCFFGRTNDISQEQNQELKDQELSDQELNDIM